MDNLMKYQKEIVNTINEEYKKKCYTPKEPYIKLNPFESCPLSAVIKFYSENKCKLEITICDDIKVKFGEFKNDHEIPIIGLIPESNNTVIVECTYENEIKETYTHYIKTNKLPDEYPKIDIIKKDLNKMQNGMMSMSLGKSDGVKTIKHLYSIIDDKARVRWLYEGVACHVFSKLKNGNLIVDAPISSGICGAYTAAGFVEMDFLGRIIEFYPIENGLHHDVIEIDNGNFLAITQRENTKQDLLVEIDRQSKKVIKEWDFREILDFKRETVIDKISVNHPLDWLHLNSLVYDKNSNSIIASSRNQSTVVKFDKDTSDIKWILAPHYGWNDELKKYLLNPIGEDFEFSYAQHTPVINKEGNLLIFDNGNFRSYKLEEAVLACDNYSRGVEYKIDEENMTVKQVWQYGKQRGHKLYCAYLGAVRLLENDNKLLCFGGITKDIFGNPIDDMKSNRMKNQTTIIEVCEDEVVFEINIKDNDITKASGYKCYRAEKIDLY
ncbi:MAG: aryl-sulfate sulfotransferase [Peptostreptococcaceae bacterium]